MEAKFLNKLSAVGNVSSVFYSIVVIHMHYWWSSAEKTETLMLQISATDLTVSVAQLIISDKTTKGEKY